MLECATGNSKYVSMLGRGEIIFARPILMVLYMSWLPLGLDNYLDGIPGIGDKLETQACLLQAQTMSNHLAHANGAGANEVKSCLVVSRTARI